MNAAPLPLIRLIARRPARVIVGLFLAGATLLTAIPLSAQEAPGATPDPARISVACDALFGGTAATPDPAQVAAEATSLDEIPFDLLAIDTQITHYESMVALTSVAEAGASAPELALFAGDSRGGYQAGLDDLREWRTTWYPDSPVTPTEFRTALLDRSLAASGTMAGGGFGPPSDPLLRAHTLCDAAAANATPFDAATIDLISGELRDGVAVALLVAQESTRPELAAFGTTASDTGTTAIGALATWRDVWFGTAVPIATPELPDHTH